LLRDEEPSVKPRRRHHPIIGEIEDGEPVVVVEPEPEPEPKPMQRRYAEDVEEVVIEAPRAPEKPSTRRIIRTIASVALRRLANLIDGG
jgi:hypothetical protein